MGFFYFLFQIKVMDSRGCFSVDPDKMVTNPKKLMKVGLQIKANLENVTSLIPENVQEFCWHLKLKCTECGEIPDHWQYVTLSEEQPLKPRHPSQTPPRGKTNFTSKCKLCSYQNTLDIKEDTIVSYDAEDINNFKTIVVFSCRGLEPVDFDPKDGWQAHGYTENVDSDDSEGKGQSVIRLQIEKTSKSFKFGRVDLLFANQKEFETGQILPDLPKI